MILRLDSVVALYATTQNMHKGGSSMKRKFIVEIDYEELEKNLQEHTEVLQDVAVELAIETLMRGYQNTKCIKGDYSVEVKEIV